MQINIRAILMVIIKGLNIATVVLITAILTHVLLLGIEVITLYQYIVALLTIMLVNTGLYFYIVNNDYILTIQLLTDYGFGEEAELDEVLTKLDAYCSERGWCVDSEED